MKIGNIISWGAVRSLGLPAFKLTLSESGFRREIKVYKVPTEVRKTRTFVSVKEGASPEEAPPCLIRDTDLLLHFSLDPLGRTDIFFAHPALRAA